MSDKSESSPTRISVPVLTPDAENGVAARWRQGFEIAFWAAALLRTFGTFSIGYGLSQVVPSPWAPITVGLYMLGIAKICDVSSRSYLRAHQEQLDFNKGVGR